MRGSKSQTRPVFGKDLTVSNYSALLNSKDDANQGDETILSKKATVRAKSEHRKKKALHKDTVMFNERISVMKKRRNIFFADSVKYLGKNKA